jgi:branched-chain amino acid transport system ATP-binding protein
VSEPLQSVAPVVRKPGLSVAMHRDETSEPGQQDAPGNREPKEILDVRGLSVRYGAVAALRGVDLTVRTGEIVALLGPNGAGKSSMARAITGMLSVHGGSLVTGEVVIAGRSMHKASAAAIVKAGVSQVLEGRQTVAELTVAENLRIGGYVNGRQDKAGEVIEEVLSLFPVLRERYHDRAGYLSGGEQQMLVIGRALMQRPRLLILDEPTLGLSPKIAGQIYELIRAINETGRSLLLIEQNATAAFELSHRAYLLESGRVVLDGSAAEMAANDHVRETYLGVSETEQSYAAALGAELAPATDREAAVGDRLVVKDLTLTIGGIKPINGVSFTVKHGEFFAVIGPNGAGKTSLMNSLSGFYKPQQGSITFDGQELLGLSPSKIARLGFARTFQNLALFDALPVIDNVMVGRERFRRQGALAGAIWVGPARREELVSRELCSDLVDLVGLSEFRNRPVGALPYGHRKRVELARALASEPRMLLLDEPVAGMGFEETAQLASYVLRAKKELDLSVLMVEHDLHLIMDLADRILVLDFGQPLALDVPEVVRANPAVVTAYLGSIEQLEELDLPRLDNEEALR